MKFFKYTVGLVLFFSFMSMAFAFTPRRIEPVDIRAEGMGSAYITDSESFFTLFSNPAGLTFSGRKKLQPTFLSSTGIFPFDMFQFISDTLITGTSVDDYYVDRTSRIRAAPLTFGSINRYFGWGVLNTFYANVQDSSGITKSVADFGGDLSLVLGSSIPFYLGNLGTLSFGFSARGIAQLEFGYGNFLESFSDKIPMEIKPTYTTLGVGFDIGLRYELSFLNLAVVFQDAYTALWTKEFSPTDIDGLWRISPFEKSYLAKKLVVGIGLDIPVERLTRAVSHFGIYADYGDVLLLSAGESVRNPLLDLSVGTELVLFDALALRLGMSEMYPSFGLGVYMHNFRLDFSVYSRELGFEPGDMPELNSGISMTIQY